MRTTTRAAQAIIQSNPGISVKALSEAVGEPPMYRTMRFVEMLRRNKLVAVDGVGVLATLTSPFPDEPTAVQAARNAGVEVDLHV